MKKKEFFEKLADALEIEDMELNEDINLDDLDEYDSLAVLSIIAMVDEEFGVKIPGLEFKTISTVKNLIEVIGEDNFE